MSKQRAIELREMGDRLFSKRSGLLSVWQGAAEQFYIERADFTSSRSLSSEFGEHLMTGAPAMARRDLANSLSSMLRPRGQSWFLARTGKDAIDKDPGARRFLDALTDIQRSAMYATKAQFVRATKQGDNDFVTFGQTVIEPSLSRNRDSLLYRNWHLRDCVWSENADFEIDAFHRKGKLTAAQMYALFPKTADAKIRECAEKDPYKEYNYRRIVVPSDQYDLAKSSRFPFVSLYIDCDHDTVLEEKPQKRLGHVIPRWQTVSGSQYAYSPATVIAVADARLLQQITLTLLEAGQKAVDPPMAAVGEAISGGVNTYAGGITWLDSDYDERLGDAIRTLPIDSKGLNWGVDREQRIEQLISKAFYLDQIKVPETGDVRSATEMRIRHEEWMRSALPLFEPMEMEYNGALCSETFELLLENNAFADLLPQMPQALKGQELKFEFESPIQSAAKRANAQAFQESAQLLAIAAQIDPTATHVFNVRQGLKDALEGASAPATWIASDEEVAAADEQAMQEMQARKAMEMIGGAAATGSAVGQAAQDMGKAGQELAMAGMG